MPLGSAVWRLVPHALGLPPVRFLAPNPCRPRRPPKTQGVENIGRLTPVITAQSDTVTRRSMTETRVVPLMVTLG